VVSRAWSDPAFNQWLLRDATTAIASLGYTGLVLRTASCSSVDHAEITLFTALKPPIDFCRRVLEGEHLGVVENTPTVHNVVVCTLCSSYPWPVLGLPPVWYKSAPYRSRVGAVPRSVLQERGLVEPDTLL
jgi:nitrile hydratase